VIPVQITTHWGTGATPSTITQFLDSLVLAATVLLR